MGKGAHRDYCLETQPSYLNWLFRLETLGRTAFLLHKSHKHGAQSARREGVVAQIDC